MAALELYIYAVGPIPTPPLPSCERSVSLGFSLLGMTKRDAVSLVPKHVNYY